MKQNISKYSTYIEKNKMALILLVTLLSTAFLFGCSTASNDETVSADASDGETVDIQILATSDLHGKFMPWDYLQDSESANGSMTQLATAVKEKRDENTLVLDAGDIIQDNLADTFLNDDIHPMSVAMNYIGYDGWTTGNHEYNYGKATLKKLISTTEAPLLLCNVYDENGQLIGDPYRIYECGGIHIAVIGMVTPNILRWDEKNLEGWTVTSPVEECKKLIPELEDKADIIIALAHMGLNSEYGTEGSGAAELAESCPELNLIIASHDHVSVEGTYIGNVLIVENKKQAQTMAEIHISVEKQDNSCNIVSMTSSSVDISTYAPDAQLTEILEPMHERALEEAHETVGELQGGNLVPENEIVGIPTAEIEDTALVDLILNTELYYSGADVAAVALTSVYSQLKEGGIRKCDVANVYRYSNTLYTVKMTGAQLKKYMEWSASYYQQYQDGNLTIAFNPEISFYNYDMFQGVNYAIDISKPVGERIVSLTWPNGTMVKDDDSITVAINDYRCKSQLLTPGIIFEEDNLPQLIEMDIHSSDIGGMRELITDYIVNVHGGVIKPDVDYNWKIIGNNWDTSMHQKAVEQINSGVINLPASSDGKKKNVQAVTINDLK